MQIDRMDRIAVLGASRGLGAEVVRQACAAGHQVVGFARKTALLEAFGLPGFSYVQADFSSTPAQELVLRHLLEGEFTKLFLVAAGGPYGRFEERAFKDHDWAWEVSFRFPARVLHSLLKARKFPQVIVIGSAVAESQADPMAASYSAAKHALRGLTLTLRAENPHWDLRLFSPGYMDTDLLPKNAAVRQRGVFPPALVALELWNWSLQTDNSGQKVYPKHPT